MTKEKFKSEIDVLKKFFEFYCKDHHSLQEQKNITLSFDNTNFSLHLDLCQNCLDTINYSFKRLQNCPHEIKPRCRTCPKPCYEKKQWRSIAKIMKYSAIRLGLSKVKQKVKNLFTK